MSRCLFAVLVMAALTVTVRADICSSQTSCRTCAAIATCGWCSAGAVCMAGSVNGPNAGACDSHMWIGPSPNTPSSACADSCGDNTTTTCQSCVNYGGFSSCGWCADYGGGCWQLYAGEYSNCQNGYAGSNYQCSNPVLPWNGGSSSGTNNTTTIWIVIVVVGLAFGGLYGYRYYKAWRQKQDSNERIAAGVPAYVPSSRLQQTTAGQHHQ